MRFQQQPEEEDASEDLDLEKVLDHYGVRYRPTKRGNQVCSCPLHDDRHPSMSVHLAKGAWKCHSCGNGGGAYRLIMLKEEIDFGGARRLAASLGLAARDTGDGHGVVPGQHQRWGSPLPPGQGDRQGAGGYRPAWRRRGS